MNNNEITSICIPRMESSISREYIYTTFHQLNIGHIDKLTEILLRNDPTYKRILLKIRLNNSKTAFDIKEFLEKSGSVKIVYNMPWYWKVVPTGGNRLVPSIQRS